MENRLEKFAIIAIQWIGSIKSLFIHTLLFVVSFLLYFLGFDMERILIFLTTIVSLEAIYLAIFIQMSVNLQSKKLHEVASDVEDIQEDVEDIQENVEDIQENVEDIQENVDDIQEDVDELQKDVDEIQKDVEEISSEEDEEEDDEILVRIEKNIEIIVNEVAKLKQQQQLRRKI
jgi:peptidoglycan hydrolase CwlO-like protein